MTSFAVIALTVTVACADGVEPTPRASGDQPTLRADGDEPTLREYFTQQLELVIGESKDRSDRTFSTYVDALSEEESAVTYREFFESSARGSRDLADGLADIRPRSAYAAEHAELIEAASEQAAFTENQHDDMKEVGSLRDVERVLARWYVDTTELMAVAERFETSKCDLEDIAEENDISVDLDCIESVLPFP